MTAAVHIDGHLSPRACLSLATIAGTVGLAASGVATWFYVLGLLQLEPQGDARTALIAAGVLLTVGQLAAFGIAAAARGQLLPGLRHTLRLLGAALFVFECGSMALTQLALVQSADVVASAADARVGELQHAIEARRATAARQRELAATQQQAQAITAAARSLRAAEAAEALIEPLAAELQQLQAARRPTLSTLLGSEQRVALFATARAALIALVGLVMTGTAGALFRSARGAPSQPVHAYLPTTGKRHATAIRPVDRQATKESHCGCSKLPAAAPIRSTPTTGPSAPSRLLIRRISEIASRAPASATTRTTVKGPSDSDICISPCARSSAVGIGIGRKILKLRSSMLRQKQPHFSANFADRSRKQPPEARATTRTIAEGNHVPDA